MENVNTIWDELIEMSRKLTIVLEREIDMDAKLDAFDNFLTERVPLVDALKKLPMINDQRRIDTLFELDQKIQSTLESWMKDTRININELIAQREAMLKIKRSSGGYVRQTASSEGYFFDKKK